MRAPVFDDLLDAHLASAPPGASRPSMLPQGVPSDVEGRHWTPGRSGTATTYGFFFSAHGAAVMSVPGRAPVAAVPGFRRTALGTDAPQLAAREPRLEDSTIFGQQPVTRPSQRGTFGTPRTLSASERAALADMNELGAALSLHFTVSELRHAFRRLALEYHPDRHPSRSADERAQLSDRFTRARGAYQILRAVLTRRA